MKKTLQNTSVVVVPQTLSVTYDEGEIGIRYDSISGALVAQVHTGKTENDKFVVRESKDVSIEGADLESLQSAIDTFVGAVWTKLKSMGEVDFE